MKSTGNGTPQTCLTNLLRMRRGEVRLDYLRGIDPSITDKPITEAIPLLRADGYWLAANYEPRLVLDGIDTATILASGDHELNTRSSAS